ncbi:ras-associated and pleckstrin homology domains-containing protein 1b isoform X2 [Thalassophryne amazonica]|uniref:ras-associated and pleckstrin homology domains-containing protein 1b isoform X2 n=1 Tax=Thalassophryne amazonica TaxID=390379 RepID=UPI001471A41E|nr:ras-associated and pleckstrin homology domains-containing protein 1b isoform X2 [Thalassophryne amazonica]
MEQVSDDELDHGAEEDSDKEDQDLDKMFGAWLGELDKLTQSLDDGRPQKSLQKPPLRQETNMANFSYRFSMYNINEALNQGDTVDLDALMADLCSIEQELNTISKPSSTSRSQNKSQQRALGGRGISTKQTGTSGGGSSGGSTSSSTRASPANTVRGGSLSSQQTASNISLDEITTQLEKASLSMDEAARQTSSSSSSASSSCSYPSTTARRASSGSSSSGQHCRTDSVGAGSEQEAPSQRSSVNSACASASSMDSLDIDKVMTAGEVESQSSLSTEGQNQTSTEHSYLDRETSLILKSIAGKPSHLLTKEEQAAKLKAEKIRVALEKIKEAQVKKLVIRVHMSDESSKTMMVDERQTVRQVLDSLLDKSHCGYSPDWSLVETITELQMERIFEDHENLVENLLNWTRDSHNKLMFIERIEKYALFKNPQNYLLGRKETSEMADRNKEALLEDCFCGGSVSVPEIEGVLWLKEDGKKSWKKRYFLLRASGIYYVPKGKAKASRDLVCFLQLDHVNVYYGQDYRSKYKSPTDYCLALKHPQIQKKSQYIKYLCCDDVRTLHQWVNGIRIAKYGKQLYANYQEAMKRTEAAYDWSSLSTSSIRSGSSSASIPESQSNHSGHSDSGVDTSSSHGRSQSVVSSIFSEAWKRGTQIEENSKMRMETSRGSTLSHGSHTHRHHSQHSAEHPAVMPPPQTHPQPHQHPPMHPQTPTTPQHLPPQPQSPQQAPQPPTQSPQRPQQPPQLPQQQQQPQTIDCYNHVPPEEKQQVPPTPPPPPPPPLPPPPLPSQPLIECVPKYSPTVHMYKYSTITRLYKQNASQGANHYKLPNYLGAKVQQSHGPTPSAAHTSGKTNVNHIAARTTVPPPPPPPPPQNPTSMSMLTPVSAMAALKFGTPSPAVLPAISLPPPIPPADPQTNEMAFPPPPPPPPPPPTEPVPMSGLCRPIYPNELKHALKERFPSPPRDLPSSNEGLEEPPPHVPAPPLPPPPPPPPPTPQQFPVPAQFPPPPAPPPAPPKTFTLGFIPHTTGKPVSPVSPFPPAPPSAVLSGPAPPPPPPPPPPPAPAPLKKQFSLQTGHTSVQPPPTLLKQQSLSKPTSVSTGAPASASSVKQIASKFPGASLQVVSHTESPKVPLSPPAVKTKPKWQPGGVQQLQSPEFPPPPSDGSTGFPAPPPPPPPLPVTGPTPPPPPLPPVNLGSSINRSPPGSSSLEGKKPPPTPQRNSSIKSNASPFYQESRRNLLSKFAPQTNTSPASSCSVSSSKGSPSKDFSNGPPAPPKPGKLNLANLPLALQAKVNQVKQSGGDFPSPPPECTYFPPPPPASELLPPPPPPGSDNHSGPPRVAVVNPQPQAPPPPPPPPVPLISNSSWGKGSLKKTPPPTLARRNNTTAEPPPLSPPHQLPPPTSPKDSSGQPNFLEDLHRTLKRKSVGRQGSLNSSGLSGKLDPIGTMDDMALPPPPPELLLDQENQSNGGNGAYMSGNISGYATLRRGPPPAPPKRGDATKLTG